MQLLENKGRRTRLINKKWGGRLQTLPAVSAPYRGAVAEKRQFRAIKGTRDILPPDSALWNRFEQIARNVFESYGFGEIRLPIFEETELFARSIGADTDVVGKEMYTFEDREES